METPCSQNKSFLILAQTVGSITAREIDQWSAPYSWRTPVNGTYWTSPTALFFSSPANPAVRLFTFEACFSNSFWYAYLFI